MCLRLLFKENVHLGGGGCSILELKGIVHLNIIFSYMKFNKICNLDHPVY